VIDVDQGEGFYRNLTIGGTEGRDDYTAVRAQLNWDLGDKTAVLLSVHAGEEGGSVPPYDVTGVYTPESFALLDPNGGVGGAIGGAASGTLVRCAAYGNGTVTGATADCVRGHDGLIAGDVNPFTSLGHDFHNVDNESRGGFLRIEHDFGAATFTSISSYEYFERDQEEVGDNSPIYTGTWIFWYSELEQYTQEFRLNSNGNGRLNYVAGLFYENDELHTRDYLTLGAGEVPGLGGFDTDFDQAVEALAAFGNVNYELTDELTLTLGLRYSMEDTKIDGGTCFAAGIDRSRKDERPTSGCLAQLTSSDEVVGGNNREDTNTSFVAALDWAPAALEGTMIYGSVSTGFRSGGFNADLATEPGQFNSLDPEEITAYEVGFKSTFNDNRMRLNAALFYYDFQDGFINVDNPQSPVPFTINAAGLDVVGLELDFQWLIAESWRLNAGLGLLDAEISSDLLSDGESIDGNRPVNSPKSSFNIALSYSTILADRFDFEANINYDWRDDQHFETNNKPVDRQEAYGLINAYAGISSGQWHLSVWGKNLADEEYKVYVNDLPVFGWTLANFGNPRTYGLTLSYRTE
jgi:iron complex outermembrane recepter protein